MPSTPPSLTTAISVVPPPTSAKIAVKALLLSVPSTLRLTANGSAATYSCADSTNPTYDYLAAGDGDNTLQGGLGSDTLHGDTGNDILAGDGGDDSLRGDEGDDILYGGAGNDSLYGEAGNDILAGGPGNDL